jgi:phage gp36-like protein
VIHVARIKRVKKYTQKLIENLTRIYHFENLIVNSRILALALVTAPVQIHSFVSSYYSNTTCFESTDCHRQVYKLYRKLLPRRQVVTVVKIEAFITFETVKENCCAAPPLQLVHQMLTASWAETRRNKFQYMDEVAQGR